MNYKYINGFKIYSFQSITDFINYVKDKNAILVAMNAEKIMNDNTNLLSIVNSNIAYPDGEGCVLALKQKGLNSVKLAGSKLWIQLIKLNQNKKFYLTGSTNLIINKTVDILKKEFPQLNIVGFRDGFLRDGDKSKLIEDLKLKKPDIIFVAQGSPRQEILMNELIQHYPALYMGLGGSFEVYSGYKKDTPKFLHYLKLEWLYRILIDLKRIKRLPKLLKFIYYLLFRKL